MQKFKHLLLWSDNLLKHIHEGNRTIFLLANWWHILIFAYWMLHVLHRLGWKEIWCSQQIYDLLIVNLYKWDFYYCSARLLAKLRLLEDLLDDPRDDALFLLIRYNSSSAHSVGFATAGLAIGKNSGIVSFEASKNKFFYTTFLDFDLLALLCENLIECEAAIFADQNLVIGQVLNTRVLADGTLLWNHGSHSQGHFHPRFLRFGGPSLLFAFHSLHFMRLLKVVYFQILVTSNLWEWPFERVPPYAPNMMQMCVTFTPWCLFQFGSQYYMDEVINKR